MAKVIIYKNPNGNNVCVCNPNSELNIEEILAKDCPTGAIIVDDSELPVDYFDAWELVNGKVVVNEIKKQVIIADAQAVIDTKASALAKLAALGLTQDEVKALVG